MNCIPADEQYDFKYDTGMANASSTTRLEPELARLHVIARHNSRQQSTRRGASSATVSLAQAAFTDRLQSVASFVCDACTDPLFDRAMGTMDTALESAYGWRHAAKKLT